MHGLWLRSAGSSLIAGLGFSLSLLVFPLGLATTSVPEVLGDGLTRFIPPAAFSFLIVRLEGLAKPLLLAGLLVVMVVLGAGTGIGAAWAWRRYPSFRLPPWDWLILSLGLWLLTMAVLVPLVGGKGVFGSEVSSGWGRFSASALLSFLLYGFLLSRFHHWWLPQPEEAEAKGIGPSKTRRQVLQGLALGGLAAVGGGYLYRLLSLGTRGMGAGAGARGLAHGQMPPVVTPNESFYVVSKNFMNPELDARDWLLEIDGLVERPMKLSLEALRAVPSQEEYVTLECISNPVGGLLMSNALWRGVPLKTLLDMAGLKPGVEDVSLYAQDGYTESIPLEVALRPQVMVAYEMNGEPLPSDHGYPARLLIPGRFGLKSVKWLTTIFPVDQDFKGYWQQRGWSDEAVVKTTSQVRVPADRAMLPVQEAQVGGVAFAGDRGISRVEVSFDDGETWLPAEADRPLSPYTWVLWRAAWRPSTANLYRLAVRATDGQGRLQIARYTSTAPDGATGLHRIGVTVERSQPPQGG